MGKRIFGCGTLKCLTDELIPEAVLVQEAECFCPHDQFKFSGNLFKIELLAKYPYKLEIRGASTDSCFVIEEHLSDTAKSLLYKRVCGRGTNYVMVESIPEAVYLSQDLSNN